MFLRSELFFLQPCREKINEFKRNESSCCPDPGIYFPRIITVLMVGYHVVSLLYHILSTRDTNYSNSNGLKRQRTKSIILLPLSKNIQQPTTTTTTTMANNMPPVADNKPPQWADIEASELLEKDLKTGRIPLEKSKAWTLLRVYNLPDRPQFRLYEYTKFITNLRNLRNHIKVKRQAGAVAALALAHDRSIHGGIYLAAATNYQQGGAPPVGMAHWRRNR